MDNVVFYLKEISMNLAKIHIELFIISITLIVIGIFKNMGKNK